ncbi:coordinator of PRMT5 and differentiation stimulator isoform X2 [Mixophyes fleayi]|uniref:coordinator of PRMT5 and differentiation stimulator isoform X2 n=1 Tax=Mixophyes fleayi TaxID=3061075 RepID=UPI003F4DDEF3
MKRQIVAGKLPERRPWQRDVVITVTLNSAADGDGEGSGTAKSRIDGTGSAQTSQDEIPVLSNGVDAGMNGFVSFVSQEEEISRTEDKEDDGQSDTSEATSEAWSVDRRYWRGGSSEEDDKDFNNESAPTEPRTYHYEQEDWDAEMLACENPYDEEDLADDACEQHITLCGYQSRSEGSYIPSLHHVPPIECYEMNYVGELDTEAGQFDDAEQ